MFVIKYMVASNNCYELAISNLFPSEMTNFTCFTIVYLWYLYDSTSKETAPFEISPTRFWSVMCLIYISHFILTWLNRRLNNNTLHLEGNFLFEKTMEYIFFPSKQVTNSNVMVIRSATFKSCEFVYYAENSFVLNFK